VRGACRRRRSFSRRWHLRIVHGRSEVRVRTLQRRRRGAPSSGTGPDELRATLRMPRSERGRHDAAKTPYHAWSHSSTRVQKRPSNTRTVQHNCAQPAIVRHRSDTTFNQGVRSSTLRRPTRSCCIWVVFGASFPPRIPASRRNADILTPRPVITARNRATQTGTEGQSASPQRAGKRRSAMRSAASRSCCGSTCE
jgi:hypothetical protein